MDKHDVTKLEAKIKELLANPGHLSGAAAGGTGDADLASLIPIIHRPGWTTIAEFRLVEGIVDAMLAQAKQLAVLKTVLLEASRVVGTTGTRT